MKVFAPACSGARPPSPPGRPPQSTGTSATLRAKVDPENIPVTDCHFEYLTDAAFQANSAGDRFAGADTSPCDNDPGSGSGDVAVSAAVSGLDPITVYHFRIVASNANPGGAAAGPDQTFTTKGPLISATNAKPVTATTATLNAKLNPQGTPTTYHFEYGPTASYGHSTPESAPLGGTADRSRESEHRRVSPRATTYHFRIVATNADANANGPDATFTTVGTPDNCPNASLRSGFGANLPDCRAYEQASPVKSTAVRSPATRPAIRRPVTAAPSPSPTTTASRPAAVPPVPRPTPRPGATTAGPPRTCSPSPSPVTSHPGCLGWDEDLTTALSNLTGNAGRRLFATDVSSGASQAVLSVPKTPGQDDDITLADYAADPSHFTFSTKTALAPGAVLAPRTL